MSGHLKSVNRFWSLLHWWSILDFNLTISKLWYSGLSSPVKKVDIFASGNFLQFGYLNYSHSFCKQDWDYAIGPIIIKFCIITCQRYDLEVMKVVVKRSRS